MTPFVVGEDRNQSTLFLERLEDYLSGMIRSGRSMFLSMSLIWPGWVLAVLSRRRQEGRPAYHPVTLLKITSTNTSIGAVEPAPGAGGQRNIELVWLTGRLMPDFKTIADFRKDNGEAIRKVCREFVVL